MFILCDLDSTLVDFWSGLLLKAELRFGVKATIDDVTDHEISKNFDEATAKALKAVMNEPGFFADLKPYPDAVAVLHQLLHDQHRVEIATSPPSFEQPIRAINAQAAMDKIRWVQHHLPWLSNSVTISKRKARIWADVIIDDAPYVLSEWCDRHPEGLGILIHHPWNKSWDEPENCRRANLSAVPQIVREWEEKKGV